MKKFPIALLIALVGFPQISETIYTPALPDVAEGLSTTASFAEATLSIYFLGFALGVFLWGTLSDNWGRKKAMLAGLVIYGLATFGCTIGLSIEALLFCRFVQAFGASVGSVITQTILRDRFEGAERSKMFSLIAGALAFSPAIGPLLGGFITQNLGWRSNFGTLVILSLLLILWTYLSLPETGLKHSKRQSMTKLFKEMMTTQSLWGHLLLIAGTNGILFGFYQEGPFVFIEKLGMTPSHYGLFGLLIASATLFASKVSHLQTSKRSFHSLILQGALFIFLASVILLTLALFGFFSVNPLVCFCLFGIFFGIGLIIPNSLSHALKPFQQQSGTASSLFGGCYYLLIAGFTWLLSVFQNGSTLPLPLYIIFLASVLGLACFMIKDKKLNYVLHP